MIYKLISKVVANRLKGILPHVISLPQSAFVPDRLITINILVAHEIIHFLRKKRMGKEGFMSLKLDMCKTYDRVSWSFLEFTMVKMCFSKNRVDLIMTCVSTVSLSVLINGEPKGPIIPSKGLRQGILYLHTCFYFALKAYLSASTSYN